MLRRAIEGAMSQTSTENHKVLVLGAGYVSYPVIDYITKHNDTAVTVGKKILNAFLPHIFFCVPRADHILNSF